MGVPADRAARPGAELAPVFAALAEAEAGRIRADAMAEAERRLEAARRQAAALVEDARRRAPEVRAETAEANATRRRVRALAHHWILVLSEALAALELELEELERAEAVRREAAPGTIS